MIKTKWFDENDDLTDIIIIEKEVFSDCLLKELEEINIQQRQRYLGVYDGKKPVAIGRVTYVEGRFIIDKIAVLEEERGQKYGDFVLRLLIRYAYEHGGQKQYVQDISAMAGFYEKLGFVLDGETYEKAGKTYINMVRMGDVSGVC